KRSAPWDIEHHLHVVEAPPRFQDVLSVLPDVRRQLPAKSRDSQSENYCRKPAQYFGILGSIFSAHARMPPVRFLTLLKPAWRRNSTAFADRIPERQWATISRLESSSLTRFGRSFSGIRYPFKLQIWYSCGSRTSRTKR